MREKKSNNSSSNSGGINSWVDGKNGRKDQYNTENTRETSLSAMVMDIPYTKKKPTTTKREETSYTQSKQGLLHPPMLDKQ